MRSKIYFGLSSACIIGFSTFLILYIYKIDETYGINKWDSLLKKEFYSTLIKIDDENFYYFMDRSCAEMDLAEYDLAINDGLRAVELAPELYITYYICGSAYYYANQPEMAKEYFLRVAELAPSKTDAYLVLSLLSIRQDDYPMARNFAQKCLGGEDNDDCMALSGLISYLTGNNPTALREFRQSRNIKAYLYRWLIKAKLEDVQAANKELASAADIFKDDGSAIDDLVLFYVGEIGEQELLKRNKGLIKQNETSNLVYYFMGQYYLAFGDDDKAISYLMLSLSSGEGYELETKFALQDLDLLLHKRHKHNGSSD